MTDTHEAPAIESSPAHDFIANTVAEHPVALFMKGTPEQPGCGFSAIVVQILDHLGVDFAGVNVLQSDALRQGIKSYSDWPTIPQLYVQGRVRRRLRHRARDVPVGRTEDDARRQGPARLLTRSGDVRLRRLQRKSRLRSKRADGPGSRRG